MCRLLAHWRIRCYPTIMCYTSSCLFTYLLTALFCVVVRQLCSRGSPDRFRARLVRSRECRRVGRCWSRDRHPHPASLCRHFRRHVQRRPTTGPRLVDSCLWRPGHVLRGCRLPWTVRRHLADSDQQWVLVTFFWPLCVWPSAVYMCI